MSASHLPPGTPLPPTPTRVLPLLLDLGQAAGHRLVLLGLEVWDGWADLRFARIEIGGGRPLKRRVPPAEAWSVWLDDDEVEVFDAVGRGERAFSNGEVRLTRVPRAGQILRVEVTLSSDAEPLRGSITVPEH